jgi:uncharacterized protein (DUF1810 family)
MIKNQTADQELELHMEEIQSLLSKDFIEPTQALNIIINAVQVCFESDIFGDLDKALISKSLDCFKHKIDGNENFEIIVKH